MAQRLETEGPVIPLCPCNSQDFLEKLSANAMAQMVETDRAVSPSSPSNSQDLEEKPSTNNMDEHNYAERITGNLWPPNLSYTCKYLP